MTPRRNLETGRRQFRLVIRRTARLWKVIPVRVIIVQVCIWSVEWYFKNEPFRWDYKCHNFSSWEVGCVCVYKWSPPPPTWLPFPHFPHFMEFEMRRLGAVCESSDDLGLPKLSFSGAGRIYFRQVLNEYHFEASIKNSCIFLKATHF